MSWEQGEGTRQHRGEGELHEAIPGRARLLSAPTFPSWQGSVPHPTAGSNLHTHVVCALIAPREEWKHLEVTCKQAALSVNKEI